MGKFRQLFSRGTKQPSSSSLVTPGQGDSSVQHGRAGVSTRNDQVDEAAVTSDIANPTIQHDDTIPELAPTSSVADAQQRNDTTDLRGHLWLDAYQIFCEKNADLAADFERHLQSNYGVTGGLKNDSPPSLPSNPGSISKLVSTLLDIRVQKQWQVSISGSNIKLRDQIQKLAKFLTWSNSIVKDALSAQPYAALAWSGVSMFVPLISFGAEQHDKMIHGFTTSTDIQLFWASCEETFLSESYLEHYQSLQKPLSALYSLIIEYQVLSVCHLSKHQLHRAWQKVSGWNDWPAKEAAIRTCSDDCKAFLGPGQQQEARQQIARQLDIMESSYSVQTDLLQAIQSNDQDSKERDLLKALILACPSYDDDKDFNPPRTPGTCEWFFTSDKFLEWRNNPSSTVLWVSAAPGCGKSVLAKALIDEHLDNSITTIGISQNQIVQTTTATTVCYFFFKDGYEKRVKPSNAISAILHQLFSSDSNSHLMQLALPSHRSYSSSLTSKFSVLWNILISCAASDTSGNIICVLDALDECEEHGRQDLLSKLNDLYQNRLNGSSKIKFLITSRAYDDIELSIQPSIEKAEYMHFDADASSDAVSEDINLVIDSQVGSLSYALDAKGRSTIAHQLKSMGTRTYLWFHLIFAIIKDNATAYSRESDIEDLLSDFPAEVSDVYERMLNRVKSPERTALLLQILMAASRPLDLEEANYALTLALEKERAGSLGAIKKKRWTRDFKIVVKNLCGLLVNVHKGQLTFIHLTAREFLTSTKSEGMVWKGRFNKPEAIHQPMAKSCINFLLIPDVPTNAEDIFELQAFFSNYVTIYCLPQYSVLNSDSFELEAFFSHYAASYWYKHYSALDSDAREQYYQDVRRLCCTTDAVIPKWAFKFSKRGPLLSWTDLAIASYYGFTKIAQLILSRDKRDVNEWCGYYGSALQAASAGGHLPVVKMLLDAGADVNEWCGYYGSALQAASAGGHLPVIKMLLDAGADVNREAGFHCTALQAAARSGSYSICDILLQHGADPNILGGTDNCALYAAMSQGKADIVRLLLFRGAKLSAIYDNGEDAKSLYIDDVHILEIIFELCGDDFIITQAMVDRAAGLKTDGVEMLKMLYKHRGNEIQITEDTLFSAVTKDAHASLSYIFARDSDLHVTKRVLCKAAECCSGEIIQLFFNYMKDTPVLPPNLWRSVCRNIEYFESAFEALMAEPRLPINQITIEDTIGCDSLPLLRRLLDRCIDDPPVSTTAMVLASRYRNPIPFLELFAQFGGVVTSDTITLAAGHCNEKALSFFLDRFPNPLLLTKEMMMNTVQNKLDGFEVLRTLLTTGQKQFAVSENLMLNAIDNYHCGQDIIELLLDKYSDEVTITTQILRDAAKSGTSDLFSLLLDHHKGTMTSSFVTDLVYLAIDNNVFGAEVVSVLLTRYGEHIVITEAMLLRVLVQLITAFPLLHVLFTLREKDIVITESILMAIVSLSEDQPSMILQFVAWYVGGKLDITERVIEAAAATGNADCLLKLLELGYLDEIPPKYSDMVKLRYAKDYKDVAGIKKLTERGVTLPDEDDENK